MTKNKRTHLVSCQWLRDHLYDPDIRIIDASWYAPKTGRNPQAEYQAQHIPGARFFDIDEISDQRLELPHMAPPPEKFISRMRAMGIGDCHRIVIYDSCGIFSAPRVWWLCQVMGKKNAVILDGGLPKWKAEGGAVTDRLPSLRDRHISVQYQPDLIKDVTQTAMAAKLGYSEIVDARLAPLFHGAVDEAGPNLRVGHIPKAKNVPFSSLIATDGTLHDVPKLTDIFAAAGVNPEKPLIAYSRIGMTAAMICLALAEIGRPYALYDGSWAEWGMYCDLPLEIHTRNARKDTEAFTS